MTTLTIILDQIRGGGDNNSKSENGANITNAGVENRVENTKYSP